MCSLYTIFKAAPWCIFEPALNRWKDVSVQLICAFENQVRFSHMAFFTDSHSFNRSPYYQGQYQSANGKVISIEQDEVITISGKLSATLNSGVRRLSPTPELFSAERLCRQTLQIVVNFKMPWVPLAPN